jgi:hypothetical protein
MSSHTFQHNTKNNYDNLNQHYVAMEKEREIEA